MISNLLDEWANYHVEEAVVDQDHDGDDEGERRTKLRIDDVRFADFTRLWVIVVQSQFVPLFQGDLVEAIGSILLESSQESVCLVFIVAEACQSTVDILGHHRILVFGRIELFPGIVGLFLVLDSRKLRNLVAHFDVWIVVIQVQAIVE